jgi:hypothetical protein
LGGVVLPWEVDEDSNIELKGIPQETWNVFLDKIRYWATVSDFNPFMDATKWHLMKSPYSCYVGFSWDDWRAYGPVNREERVVRIAVASHKNKMVNHYLQIREDIFRYLLVDCKNLSIKSQKLEFQYWINELKKNEELLLKDCSYDVDNENTQYSLVL